MPKGISVIGLLSTHDYHRGLPIGHRFAILLTLWRDTN